MDTILVTGASGQIGTDLIERLIEIYGSDNVVASDIGTLDKFQGKCRCEKLDVRDKKIMNDIIQKYKVTKIFHLASLLSATGEKEPELCWDINMRGLLNILQLSRENNIKQIIFPSSIAVFGPKTPRDNTPQDTILSPTTMYGNTKVAGELLCDYYVSKYDLDIRGVRYPGLISHTQLPGGGTTDYAVEIYHEAIKHKKYTSFLSKDTVLPMMYMNDAVDALIDLGNAKFEDLNYHSNYNLAAVSFSVEEVAQSIQKYIPEFQIEYSPDYRQAIADSWPKTIDDSCARNDWNWSHKYDLDAITKDMLENLRKYYS